MSPVTREKRPAVPQTPVQQASYDRVIAVATQILSDGGQEAGAEARFEIRVGCYLLREEEEAA